MSNSDVVNKRTQLYCPKTGRFNLSLRDLTFIHPNISFGPEVPLEFVIGLGYFPVEQVTKPVNDVVNEVTPILKEDGTYLQAYEDRPFNEQELLNNLNNKKSEVLQNAKHKINEKILKGYLCKVADEEHSIQIDKEDRFELRLLLDKANRLISIESNESIKVRTKENKFIFLKPNEYVNLYNECMDYYYSVKEMLWEYEKSLESITLIEDVKEIELF